MLLPCRTMKLKPVSEGAVGALACASALAVALVMLPLNAEAGEQPPVVVELFTSQGCSSCPPADALLTELAADPDLLALSFHVDYWDYIGWEDPFAAAEHTQRQRDYVDGLGLRYVYTPQMVIDGRHDVVGSNRREVMQAIEAAARTPAPLAVTLDDAGGGSVRIAAGDAPAEGATVWLIGFDDGHDTRIAQGENGGRSLHNSNVVRALTKLGTWSGAAASFPVDLAKAKAAGRGGCAVLVQQGRGGPILGAAIYDLDSPSG